MAHDSMEESLAESVARFETIGTPTRKLALYTRREYMRDLRDFLTHVETRQRERVPFKSEE
ncbi:MAG: hypothetical protein M3R24_37590 [Chloroflexota bacterium]|nr:hypothetical protein [Chloroflexota bacterium]